MAEADAVLAFWSEHRAQMRQSEDQRATLTNFVMVIASALAGFIVQQHLQLRTLPLALLIAGIGGYGAVAVAKYHERADYHLGQARVLAKTLVGLGALPADETRLDEQRTAHNAKYPRLHRLRLHLLWTGLHVGIAVLGVVLAGVILAVG